MAQTATTRLRGDGKDRDLAAEILETALDMAEEKGWHAVRLTEVAEQLRIPAYRILDHYRDLDAVADAWFHRGWEAMLAPKPPDFARWPGDRRIEYCMLAWLDALALRQRVTAEMLRNKMHLPHPHHWVPMIFNLSRTIQWLREAALLQATYGTQRSQMEEVGLTWLFVATLWVWSRDETPGQQRTRRFLRNRLSQADRAMVRIWGPGQPPAGSAAEEGSSGLET